MSIPVPIDELARALADFDLAYLLSSGATGVKVVSVTVQAGEGELVVPTPSGGTAANIDAHPAVTLLCPPREAGGYSLIVDGTALTRGEGFVITPGRAVLHRPAGDAATATPADTGDGCGQDCVPLA